MQSIRLFCDVAGYRSFSQAAARHGITQSAASQRVSQLEKRLGVTLLDRSVRPLNLTPAGEIFLRECRQMLQRYDRLAQRLSRWRDEPAGEVRVDAIYSAGIDWLNHLKESFEQRHRRVTVTLDYKPPEEVYDAVRDRLCDLGIVSYPQCWRDVTTIPLRNERMAVVCSPGHPLAGQASVHAAEVDRWSMATFEAHLPVGRAIRRYLRDNGAHPKISAVFDNIDTVKTALVVTDDISILPKRTVQRELAAGTLAVVELEPALDRPVGIIYRRQTRPRNGRNGRHHESSGLFAPATQALVDYLIQHAGPEADGTRAAATNRGQFVGDQR